MMLDSHVEMDQVVSTGRRCRSFNSLPRDGSDILLWVADDDGAVADCVTGRLRTSDRQQATGGGCQTERCLSASDLLTAGDGQQGDDYDPSWCSVNNLETDCVSPRVSSNSLFSQLDTGTAASLDDAGEHPPSSSPFAAAADVVVAAGRTTPSSFGVVGYDQPMYTRHSRPTLPQTTAGSQVATTTYLLRQLTAAAGGGTLRSGASRHGKRRSSMAAATRSASCPSLLYEQAGLMPPSTAGHVVNSGEEQQTVRDEMRAAEKRVMDEALAPASIIAHPTGKSARAPMMWLTARPSRSASPPTSQDTSALDCAGARRPTDDGSRKTRHLGVGSSSVMTTGATRRLARTKCLQWLNSFDEDD